MAQTGGKGRFLSLFKLLGLTFRLNPKWSAWVTVVTMLMGILPALQITVVRGLINTVGSVLTNGPVSSDALIRWAVLLGLLVALPNVVYSILPVLQGGYRESNAHVIRLAVMERIAAMEALDLEDPDLRNDLEKVERAVTRCIEPFSESLIWFCQAVVMIIAMSGFLLEAHWAVWLLAMVGGLIHLGVEAVVQSSQYRLFSAQTPLQRWEGYLVHLLTTVGPHRDLMVFGAAPGILTRWRTLILALRNEQWKLDRRNVLLSLGGRTVLLLVYLLPMAILAWRFTSGLLDMGLLVAVLSVLSSFYAGLSLLVITVAGWIGQGLHAADIVDFLNLPQRPARSGPASARPTPVNSASSAIQVPPFRKVSIELADVSFTYPRSEAPALRQINLQIRAGEWVAVVGENGSGKTTLARLLLELYPPTSGEIRADGVSGEPGQVSTVLQEFTRYSLRVRENIGFGHIPSLNDDNQLWKSAQRSGASSFVTSWSGQLEEQLGREFDGVEPSGGQWQRLAIARGMLPSAGLVILDEATSALDPEAEDKLLRDLRSNLRGATVVFIAHRLPVARLADRIIVMSGGQVAEDGTHDVLLARGGLYAKMYAAQAAWYQDSAPSVAQVR